MVVGALKVYDKQTGLGDNARTEIANAVAPKDYVMEKSQDPPKREGYKRKGERTHWKKLPKIITVKDQSLWK